MLVARGRPYGLFRDNQCCSILIMNHICFLFQVEGTATRFVFLGLLGPTLHACARTHTSLYRSLFSLGCELLTTLHRRGQPGEQPSNEYQRTRSTTRECFTQNSTHGPTAFFFCESPVHNQPGGQIDPSESKPRARPLPSSLQLQKFQRCPWKNIHSHERKTFRGSYATNHTPHRTGATTNVGLCAKWTAPASKFILQTKKEKPTRCAVNRRPFRATFLILSTKAFLSASGGGGASKKARGVAYSPVYGGSPGLR